MNKSNEIDNSFKGRHEEHDIKFIDEDDSNLIIKKLRNSLRNTNICNITHMSILKYNDKTKIFLVGEDHNLTRNSECYKNCIPVDQRCFLKYNFSKILCESIEQGDFYLSPKFTQTQWRSQDDIFNLDRYLKTNKSAYQNECGIHNINCISKQKTIFRTMPPSHYFNFQNIENNIVEQVESRHEFYKHAIQMFIEYVEKSESKEIKYFVKYLKEQYNMEINAKFFVSFSHFKYAFHTNYEKVKQEIQSHPGKYKFEEYFSNELNRRGFFIILTVFMHYLWSNEKDITVKIYKKMFKNLDEKTIREAIKFFNIENIINNDSNIPNIPDFDFSLGNLIPMYIFRKDTKYVTGINELAFIFNKEIRLNIISYLERNKKGTTDIYFMILSCWFRHYFVQNIFSVELGMIDRIVNSNNNKPDENILLYAGSHHIRLLKNYFIETQKSKIIVDNDKTKFYSMTDLHKNLNMHFNEKNKKINCTFFTRSQETEFNTEDRFTKFNSQ